jgi:hypothetical protein
MFAKRAARSRFVEALSSRGVAGDGATERPGGRFRVALGGEDGGAGLRGRWGPGSAVPQPGGVLHAREEATGTGDVAGAGAYGRRRAVVVEGAELALGLLIEQGLRKVEQVEGFGGVFGDAQQRPVDDEQQVAGQRGGVGERERLVELFARRASPAEVGECLADGRARGLRRRSRRLRG